MRSKICLLISLIVVTILVQQPTGATTSTFNLMDFGAVGDGVADDGPALQAALDALAEAGGGTLIVPEGHYAIITPVARDFTGRASSITISGVASSTPVTTANDGRELSKDLGLVSEFIPKTGSTQVAIAISGLETFLIEELTFMGTPDVTTDALVTLFLGNIKAATIRHCEFYGLSSQLSGGSIVGASRSGLSIEQSKFLGCTGNSGVYVPVVENIQWKSIAVTNTVFVDYGQRPEIFSKTGYAAAFSWINIGNAEAVGNTSPRREVAIRDIFLDEGGYFGISSLPTRYQPPSAPIDLVYISGLNMNVTNLGGAGNYLSSPRAVFIENSRYEWSQNADSAISLFNVDDAILDQVECLASANRIRSDNATANLSVINSVYTYLDSLAQNTRVITTETADEDPVQYVRQQYEALLGRGPDPAGHYYWSNLILRCGDNDLCATSARAALNSYLGSAPAPDFSITGQVTDEKGVALAGVSITLSGSQSVVTETDDNGRYSFLNLPTSGVYTVRMSKRHYSFNEPVKTMTTPAGDQTLDYAATLNRHTLRGRLTDSAGTPVAGALLTLSSSEDGTALTDAEGNYAFPSLPAGGTYTLTPSKSTYVFSPTAQTIEDLGQDQAVDFQLITYSIGGRVTRTDGSGVAGVSIKLSGSESAATTTDANGNYAFARMPAGGTYVLTPSLVRNTLNPQSSTLSSLSTNLTVNFTATLDKFTVGGHVTSNGVGLGGVTVTLSGSQTGTATTDSNGVYSFSVPSEGNYTVTPSHRHYTFTPEAQSLNYLIANKTLDFAGELKRHTISGRVVNINNYGIAGVTLTLSGSQNATAKTDADGNFSFTNLAAGGTYQVTPSLAYYSFNVPSQTFSDLGSDQYAGFVASLNYYKISGRITRADGSAIPGVTINLGGPQSGTTTTDANGNYSFPNLAAGISYSVTPSKANYSFTSLSLTVKNLDADQAANFTGALVSYQITGRMTLSGAGLSGVTVTLSGSQTATATSDSNGVYSFSVLAEGNYTVTPSKKYYIFVPESRSLNNLGGNGTADFAGELQRHTISGRIVNSNNYGIAGVTVALSGSQTGTTTTDANGNYSFPNLAAGSSYTVSPSKVNYSFTSLSLTVNNLDADQAANFTGALVSYQITGRVTLNGKGFDGVTLTLSGSQSATVKTDANGNYSLTALAEGNYLLTPAKTNYNFSPTNIGISNLSGNQVGNFTAKLNPGVPVLMSHPDSTRAIALDSVLRVDEPFDLNYTYPWSPNDRRTRVTLYAMNFELSANETAAAVTADVEDASHRIYPLTVEYVGKIQEANGVNRIIVRLSDDLGDVGDVLVRITYHGVASNRVRIGIGHVGGGPPDDPGAVPTPGLQ